MIRVGVVGVGNCASALVQGISLCRVEGPKATGVLYPDLGGYAPDDVEIVAAFDVDRRKVGRPLADAIFAPPNNTYVFFPYPLFRNVIVSPGVILDGLSSPMLEGAEAERFLPIEHGEATLQDVVAQLRAAGAEILVNFLPVGSRAATELYATAAIEAGCAFVNGIPALVASNPEWAARFAAASLPVLGDDFKSQVGATILHRTLVELMKERGAELDRSYQLNVGGNADFRNMLDPSRLATKRLSKTESVQSVTKSRLADSDLRVGPSDYVAWLNDRKVAFVRLEGRLFGGLPINIEVRMDVEDSPNAAIMALAAIRLARIALDRGLSGAVPPACAALFKHPPEQMENSVATQHLLDFARSAK